jgi:hypothetical protein
LIGRVVYFIGYLSDPNKRFSGFFIQVIAAFALLFGALGRIIYLATGARTTVWIVECSLSGADQPAGTC